MLPKNRLHFIGLLLLAAGVCSDVALAQGPSQLPRNVNYLLSADQPPGYVASAQVARQIPGVGTYQAVAISGPPGLKVALARDGMLLENLEAPVTTGMLVGATYRFRVANIPYRPGAELYPTIEIIGKVHTPTGREHRFPIPVVLTNEDIELALGGALVTRVIYVEDGEIATPMAVPAGEQLLHDVAPEDNALQTADQYGKPVAILRIGSILPSSNLADMPRFLMGSPPWIPLITAPDREQLIRDGQWPNTPPVVPANEVFSQPHGLSTQRINDGLIVEQDDQP
ncbi:MAG TPA: hypothetical protein DDW52_22890 [Planctomycetaceae bacterium]|nr:hypothetical protein [Planctomycetaceae bacterium]